MSSVINHTNDPTKSSLLEKQTFPNYFSLVCTYFDENDGPQILYTDPWINSDLLNSISVKVFSYVMSGVEFHNSSKFKITSIVRLPKSNSYALTIEFVVKKNLYESNGDVVVPLVFFVLFSPELFPKMTAFIPELESKLNAFLDKEILGCPTPQQLEELSMSIKFFVHSLLNSTA
ncbi:MAG: hypothetical protein ACTSYD_03275 [Candidatus Heimdallarchaeaceae archaeon]